MRGGESRRIPGAPAQPLTCRGARTVLQRGILLDRHKRKLGLCVGRSGWRLPSAAAGGLGGAPWPPPRAASRSRLKPRFKPRSSAACGAGLGGWPRPAPRAWAGGCLCLHCIHDFTRRQASDSWTPGEPQPAERQQDRARSPQVQRATHSRLARPLAQRAPWAVALARAKPPGAPHHDLYGCRR